MLTAGASGKTKKSLEKFFNLSDVNSIHKSSKRLSDALNKKSDQFVLDSVNAVWLRRDFKIRKKFQSTLRDDYNVSPKILKSDPDLALKEINQWVKEKTHGKINKIFDSFDTKYIFVIASALYFKGAWQHPFDASVPLDFFLNAKNTVKANFLRYFDMFLTYKKTKNEEIIHLPYKGKDFYMMIVLPRKGLLITENQSQRKIYSWSDINGGGSSFYLPNLK